MASVNSEHFAEPPKSPVFVPEVIVSKQAVSIRSAISMYLRWRNIITDESKSAVGFALSWP